MEEDPVYVDPATFSSDASGNLLLAGRVGYWWKLQPNGSYDFRDSTNVLGVLIFADGHREILRNPFPEGRPDGMRAIPLGEERWGVVLAEMPAASTISPSTPATSLWYGEVGRGGWRHLEKLDPPPFALLPSLSSGLLRTHDGFAWTIPYEGGRMLTSALLIRRNAEGWTYEPVETFTGETEPFPGRDGGLEIVAIQPDTTLQSDGNSLILRAQRLGWGVDRILMRGRVERTQLSEVTSLEDATILTWISIAPNGPPMLRALVRPRDGSPDRILTVDSGVAAIAHLAPSESGYSLAPVWMSAAQLSDGNGELRLRMLAGHTVTTIGSISYPFIGYFRLAWTGRGVAVVGAVAPENKFIASMLIYFAVQCEGPQTRG